jgi:hypothetical protein
MTSPPSSSRPLRGDNKRAVEDDEEEPDEFMNCDDLELDLSVYDKVEHHLCKGISDEWGPSYDKVLRKNLAVNKWDIKVRHNFLQLVPGTLSKLYVLIAGETSANARKNRLVT